MCVRSAVDPVNAISPLLKVGDVLLFSASCYHTPDINTRPYVRFVQLMRCTASPLHSWLLLNDPTKEHSVAIMCLCVCFPACLSPICV